MKIGISAQAIHGAKTGLGVYTENILKAITSECTGSHELVVYEKRTDKPWNTLRRLYWENVELPGLARRDAIDLLHIPAFAPPLWRPCRLVVTVHDLIGMIYPNQVGAPSRFYWGTWLPMTVRRAHGLMADSENTKRDIIRHLGVSADRVRVVYPSGHEAFSRERNGGSQEQLKKKLGIAEKYFLCVGTLEPRKNMDRVIEAFLKFRERPRGTRYQLAVVGSIEFAHGKIFKRLRRELDVDSDEIVFTGYLERNDLNLLYCGAEAFLFPSLYEGFGIPVLEAMASGVPVVTSNLSSLPEVAGDAAYFVNPYRMEEILEGMNVLAENDRVRSDLIQKGFRQIQKFSWKQTAQQVMEVYESLA